MKYTKSQDGVERCSVRVVIRIERDDVAKIRSYLKRCGMDYDDKAVREHVASMTEYIPSSGIADEIADEMEHGY